jgi:hypothetical protein
MSLTEESGKIDGRRAFARSVFTIAGVASLGMMARDWKGAGLIVLVLAVGFFQIIDQLAWIVALLAKIAGNADEGKVQPK